MNALGKILVIFIAVSSLVFFSFAAAYCTGGPDWLGELHAPEVDRDFIIEIERGDVTKYTAVHRTTGVKVADKKSMVNEVVVEVRKRLEQDMTNRLKELKDQPAKLEQSIKQVSESIAADKDGVEKRLEDLSGRYNELWSQLEALGDEFSKQTILTQDVMKIAHFRREEGLRLSNQLQIMRNDQFAAEEQKKALEYELTRLEENKRRLTNRRDQLKKQLSLDY